MTDHAQTSPAPPRNQRRGWRRVRRWAAFGCGGTVLLFAALLALLLWLLSRAAPATYPRLTNPIPPPDPAADLGHGLDGFDSPYLGHTGSWDGKGGAIFGTSKHEDLDAEHAMGLRWTFMPVYWRAMEPEGPVDPARGTPPAWAELDAFVIAAQQRGLNILMQAPVIGGNAGGPPDWAGRREPGKSAPADLEAAALAGKLAARYRPGGTLAQREGWGVRYGVRAWELDNEPDGYRTHWKGQAGDYAEFVTKAAVRIKAEDPHALILAPAVMSSGADWVKLALDAHGMHGSPAFRRQGKPFSIGPPTDVVTFHLYEGLDTFFAGKDRTIERVFSEVRSEFEKGEKRAAGFEYPRKSEYWHTEGNYDFLGLLSAPRRAAWRWQFFTRAFACGIRKVMVMDASPPEQTAVRAYVRALPDPFPMRPAEAQVTVVQNRAIVFRHPDRPITEQGGQVWIAWAEPGSAPAVIEIPVRQPEAELWQVNGAHRGVVPINGRVQLRLEADSKMPPPQMLVDRPANRADE